jgi:hypothetical protein
MFKGAIAYETTIAIYETVDAIKQTSEDVSTAVAVDDESKAKRYLPELIEHCAGLSRLLNEPKTEAALHDVAEKLMRRLTAKRRR